MIWPTQPELQAAHDEILAEIRRKKAANVGVYPVSPVRLRDSDLDLWDYLSGETWSVR